MTAQTTRAHVNRLAEEGTVPNFRYQYDDASQYTITTFAEGNGWVYRYDASGPFSNVRSSVRASPGPATGASGATPCPSSRNGHGNIAAIASANTGAVTATYEYGPFGEVIRATGPMAKVNPFMFSTKFYDWETGLYYYGYRYYNPSTGRWLSRDPVEEKGGRNLYGFTCNNPINGIDKLGQMTFTQMENEVSRLLNICLFFGFCLS